MIVNFQSLFYSIYDQVAVTIQNIFFFIIFDQQC